MIILIAVITGYILGIMPFTIPKIMEFYQNKKIEETNIQEHKDQLELIDEYLNGPKTDNSNKVNQQDIYNEYMTGKQTSKED